MYLGQGVCISLSQCSDACTPEAQGRTPSQLEPEGRRQADGDRTSPGILPSLKENECRGLMSFIRNSNPHSPQQGEFYQPCLVMNESDFLQKYCAEYFAMKVFAVVTMHTSGG